MAETLSGTTWTPDPAGVRRRRHGQRGRRRMLVYGSDLVRRHRSGGTAVPNSDPDPPDSASDLSGGVWTPTEAGRRAGPSFPRPSRAQPARVGGRRTGRGSPHRTRVRAEAPAPVCKPAPAPPAASTAHGYWLVGSDGGIFTFGSAQFYGSTGSLELQRPVVGIVPTKDRRGLLARRFRRWGLQFRRHAVLRLDPGLGLHPAGSGLPNSLKRPLWAWCPPTTTTATSWWPLTAASSPSVTPTSPGRAQDRRLLGCSGCRHARPQRQRLLAGDPDGQRLHLRRRPLFGAPGNRVTGHLGRGHPRREGLLGPPQRRGGLRLRRRRQLGIAAASNFGGFDPATAIFATSDGGGYWVSSAVGRSSTTGTPPTTETCRGRT